MQPTNEWATIPEIVRAARTKLPTNLWDYTCGGAESETTLRRNRSAFDSLAFRPRVLRGVAHRDTSTTFLGHNLSMPVLFAPVGGVGHFHPDGALAVARVSERVGTMSFVSTMSTPALEEVRSGADAPAAFQVYVRGDRSWVERLVRRAESAGFDAICLTVDSAAYGRRERDLENRYAPHDSHGRPNLEGPSSESDREDWQAAFTWDDLAWLRDTTKLPLVLKGVLSGEDAALAVEHGVNVIHVSNHGGRQLDHAPATIEVLPEIVAAVGGRADVIVDSGFMRGSDVLKALALGAKAVLIGKLMAWSLAAGGEAGLERTMDLLRTEMLNIMANIGARSVSDVGPSSVRPTTPPYAAPWPVGAPHLGEAADVL
jgi:glycolate oxidase